MENNIELEEQLISFETAKLAKEKGFNIHCRWHFDDESGDLYENEDFPYNSWNGSLFASTQSLLQKWLREKYNLNVCVLPFYGLIECIDEINSGTTKEKKKLFAAMIWENTEIVTDELETYEEALEAGLQEALKLIK